MSLHRPSDLCCIMVILKITSQDLGLFAFSENVDHFLLAFYRLCFQFTFQSFCSAIFSVLHMHGPVVHLSPDQRSIL